MANGNGRNGWQVTKDIIQYLLLPLLGLGYYQLTNNIEKNAEIMRTVSSNQIRVMAELGSIRSDLSEHEEKQIRVEIERGRVHHSAQRSCVECKMPGRDMYPLPMKKPNSLTDK